MKNLLLILSIALLAIGCSEKRVLIDELTEKYDVWYYAGEPYAGVAFDLYENGQLGYEGNYKDGEPVGLSRIWYENGQLNYEANYKDGERHGLDREWHKNGQLNREENWKDGKQDGLQRYWHENGQLGLEGNYIDGNLISEKKWDLNGNPL